MNHPLGSEPALIDLPTAYGAARAHVQEPAGRARGLLVLGHGAGGGVSAPDLVAVAAAAVSAGWRVARVEQPYRVAGRRAPDRAPKLDQAWLDVVTALRGQSRLPLVVGGRSSGARVACRTSAATKAAAVVCLAFPLHPPAKPEQSRADELALVVVPLLVVQGTRDPFGGPEQFPPGPHLVSLEDDHSLRRNAKPAAEAVVEWLTQTVRR